MNVLKFILGMGKAAAGSMIVQLILKDEIFVIPGLCQTLMSTGAISVY